MPLTTPRILHVYYINRTPAIVSAGRDLNILCSPLVELTAVLVPDGRSHTVEWVQLSGTVVELIDADTLTPYFINPNTGDLSFRVYIDRNKPYETYDDVNVYREPADRGMVGSNPKLSNVLNPSFGSGSARAGYTVTPSVVPRYYQNNTGSGAELEYAGRTTEYMIQWSIPADVVTAVSSQYFYSDTTIAFLGVYVETYDTLTSSWVPVVYVPKEYNYYIFPSNSDGAAYRLVAAWEKRTVNNKNTQKNELWLVGPDTNTSVWGIVRSNASSPADYFAHVNTGGAVGDAFTSETFSFSKSIFNPKRISYLGVDSQAWGISDLESLPFSDSVFRVNGKIYQNEDSGSRGISMLSGNTMSFAVFRVEGISIG